MKRILTISVLLLAILASITFNDTRKASAQAIAYDYEYQLTNVYDTTDIVYEFDNLDVNQTYQWGIYTVNPQTGALDRYLGMRRLGPGVTTGEWFFGSALSSPQLQTTILYPENYVGPIAVTDAFQQNIVIGRHFVAPNPLFNANGWISNAGNTQLYDKEVAGSFFNTGSCQNPVYADVNADGWQHTFIPCSVIVQSGQYTILHYQIDPAYVGPTDMVIQFFTIPTTNVVLTLDMDDLLEYQQPSATLFAPFVIPFQYVILNTSGRELPFINNAVALSAFTTEDNPMTAELDTGVYNYMRVDGGGWISDGESVLIVSDDPNGREWSIVARTEEVKDEGTQILETRAVTRNVWNSYHGYQDVIDIWSGFSDQTVYAFSPSRTFTYQVSTNPDTDVIVQWYNRAQATSASLATAEDYEFIVTDVYDIVEVLTYQETINVVLIQWGLDSPLGKAALLAILLFSGLVLCAFTPRLKSRPEWYLIVWTAIGAVYIVGGYSTELVTIVYGIITLGMWVYVITQRPSQSMDDA